MTTTRPPKRGLVLLTPRHPSARPPTLHPTPPALQRTVYSMPRERKGPTHPQEKDLTQSPTTGEQHMMVLIAEDEETIAETLATIVEDAGYVAVVAHDGHAALQLALQHRPRLIITDMMMPHMNGADLIAAVRRAAAAQGLAPPPVVVVTAVSPARAREAGADAVVPKPFDITKIETAIQWLLRREPQ